MSSIDAMIPEERAVEVLIDRMTRALHRLHRDYPPGDLCRACRVDAESIVAGMCVVSERTARRTK